MVQRVTIGPSEVHIGHISSLVVMVDHRKLLFAALSSVWFKFPKKENKYINQ